MTPRRIRVPRLRRVDGLGRFRFSLRSCRPRDVQSRHGRATNDLDRRRCLLRVLVVDGQLQRHHRPSEPPRHHHGGRIAGPVSGDCGVQETDGLELSLALIRRSHFNFDYHVSFTPDELRAGKVEYNYRLFRAEGSEGPGISVFLNDGGKIYHTYSTYERGLDMLNVAYHYMDLVPKGRDEGEGGLNTWVRRHDEYPD